MPEAIAIAESQTHVGQQEQTKKGEVQQITPDRMYLAERDRQDWLCNAYFGTTIEDVLQASYWAHMASKLKPYDHIEVRVDDSTWIADLVVLESGRNWARVMLKNKWRLDSADVSQTIAAEEFKVEFKGPQLKWCVIRLRDKHYMTKEHRAREAAEDWLRSYERTLGRAAIVT